MCVCTRVCVCVCLCTHRYRNFRTLTSPQPTQFVALAVDPAGEVVVAGTADTFQVHKHTNIDIRTHTHTHIDIRTYTRRACAHLASDFAQGSLQVISVRVCVCVCVYICVCVCVQIYVWSLKTGRLLDILAGHEGPVCCLAFNPVSNSLASGSWDKTVRCD